MDLARAIDFIREHGDVIAQARLGYILNKERPGPQVLRSFFRSQRVDGGWPPPWATGYSSLDATCFRLAQAEQLGLSEMEVPVARACQFIAQRQRKDGSWEEDRAYALVAPAWVRPGRRAARLYLTANCGFWLASQASAQHGVLLAAGYLKKYLDDQGALPSYLQTHWLAAGIWHRLGWSDSFERVSSCLSGRLDDMPSANLAWMVLSLYIAGLPADYPLLAQAARYLEKFQRADGSWPGEDISTGSVHHTLDALRALRLCGFV